MGHLVLQRHQVIDLVREGRRFQLHANEHGVQRALAVHLDLEVLSQFRYPQQSVLHLGREDIDAADDKHVVHPSRDAGDTNVGAAAGAGRIIVGCDVADAVPDHGQRLLLEHGDDQFSLLPGTELLSRLGVQDLDVREISPDVDAVLLGALGEQRSGELRRSVDIVRLDAGDLLDAVAHLLRPGLRSQDGRPEPGVLVDVDPHLLRGLSKMQHVGGSAADRRDLEVLDELYLPLGVADRCRDHSSADALRAVVQPEPAGEQPVSVADLDNILAAQTDRAQRSRHRQRPVVEVVLRVPYHRRLAGGAGRYVIADQFVLPAHEHLVRVVVPEVLLIHEGQLDDVLQRADVVGMDPGGLHAIMIER